MALWYFAERRCDFVVLEVGIGGKLDATNCIPAPAAALIAQLGFDHTETLGSTIEEIAAQKGRHRKVGQPAGDGRAGASGPAGGRAALPGAGLRLHRGGPGTLQVLSTSPEGSGCGQNLRGASAAAGRIPSGEKRRQRADSGGGAQRRGLCYPGQGGAAGHRAHCLARTL